MKQLLCASTYNSDHQEFGHKELTLPFLKKFQLNVKDFFLSLLPPFISIPSLRELLNAEGFLFGAVGVG